VTPPSGAASAPVKVRVRAPGRVNLIGDHTDYNDGFCLPVAIDRMCEIRAVRAEHADLHWRGTSAQEPDAVVVDAARWRHPSGDGDTPHRALPGWGGFVAGAIEAAAADGVPIPDGAIDFEVDSDVPVGAGLSSSAALAVALVGTIAALTATPLEPARIARLARTAETLATGVPCGVMDQLASVFGVADHALLIDCRRLSVEPIAWPASLAILVAHSGVTRALATSEYADRRNATSVTAANLGIPALRDATPAMVGRDPLARHVVFENQRVLDFASALAANDVDALGPLMLASHASLRDDYRVSTPELDALVNAFVEAGAVGARLTGAGFGGCVVAIARREDVERVTARASTAYLAATGVVTEPFVVRPTNGMQMYPALPGWPVAG
jgi:galactokinase